MSILVVGSVGLDSVETSAGKVENALGGSAIYFSVAASFFHNPIRLMAVIGDDFPQEHIHFLQSRAIDLTGLELIQGGKTFRWGGRYTDDPNAALTLFTHLNVYGDFNPKLPANHKDTHFVFLANINPELQLSVLQQTTDAKLIVCDTMNLWINNSRDALIRTLSKVDILIINDSEARLLTDESNLIRAAKAILTYGPNRVIIKKGEHGAVSLTDSTFFSAPAYPLQIVSDPTGAGDSFAGGFLGYLASTGDTSEHTIRKAIIYGTVIASFNVEDFSLNRQRSLTPAEINQRYSEIQKSVQL
ncbi:MAG: PfkB family carbohydrate kinase [Candidatus Poribacteria bacterium]|nr:PfkB family carbohydrate kinase [Candidatus Poribacteria bacterium]